MEEINHSSYKENIEKLKKMKLDTKQLIVKMLIILLLLMV